MAFTQKCLRVVKKELPTNIITLQQLSDTSGDAEAYDFSVLLASQIGVACVILLSEVLDIIAMLSTAMQMKIADFSKLSIHLNMVIDIFKDLKKEDSNWLSDVQSALSLLETEHKISIIASYGFSRSRSSTVELYLNINLLLQFHISMNFSGISSCDFLTKLLIL